jgi:hypothetical protein
MPAKQETGSCDGPKIRVQSLSMPQQTLEVRVAQRWSSKRAWIVVSPALHYDQPVMSQSARRLGSMWRTQQGRRGAIYWWPLAPDRKGRCTPGSRQQASGMSSVGPHPAGCLRLSSCVNGPAGRLLAAMHVLSGCREHTQDRAMLTPTSVVSVLRWSFSFSLQLNGVPWGCKVVT